MRIISLGKISWHLIFLFSASILYVGNLYCRSSLGEAWSKHYLIRSLFSFLGQTIIGLPSIIDFSRNRNHINECSPTSLSSFTQIQVPNRNARDYFFLSIKSVFSSFLLNIANYSLLGVALWVPMCFQIIIIITLSILSYLYLGYHYNKHHFFSFAIILIGFGLIVYSNYSELNHIILFFITLIATCLPASGEIVDKLLMDTRHFTPYKIALIEGVISVLTTLGMITIAQFIPCPEDFSKNGWCIIGESLESFTAFDIVIRGYTWAYLILMMGCYGLFVLLRKMIIFHYTPTHRSIINILGMSLYWISQPMIYMDYAIRQKIELFLGFFVTFIGYLFYNEIFIVHLCGLGKDTTLEIQKRASNQEDNNPMINSYIEEYENEGILEIME